MKDYKQTTRDIFRKRDEYLARRKKRIAYIEKGVSIMSITGILVALGLCTSMSSSIAPVPQDEPHEIDINSGISTVTSQTAQTAKFLQTARTSQNSTSILTSTGLTSTSEDITSNSSSDVTSDTAASTSAASSAVRSVLTSTDEIVTILTSTGTDSTESSTTISSDTSETTLSTSSTAETSATAATESTSSTERVDSTVEDDGIYTFAYRLCENGTNESTIYVDKDDLANGDYVVNTAIYIETDESPTDLVHAHASWNGYDINNEVTKYITFDNCSAYSDSNDLLTTDAYFAALEDSEIIDGVNITSTFAPSCFSGMRERSSGIQLTHWFSGPSNVYKSVNVKQDGTAGTTKGTTIYSAGPNKVYFDIESRGERVYIDLEYDEKTGTAVGEYSYTWTFSQQSTVKQHVESETIHIYHYDPDTPVDEPIKVVKTSVDLHGLSGNQIDEWYGGSSDYLPFTTFDTVIDKDTPEGTYYVAFKPNGANSLSTMGWKAVSTSIEDESYWLKIVVGDSAEAEEAVYDVNLDGTIGVDDATEVLRIYAETAAGTNSDIQIQQTANVNADVDGDGTVTLSDATAILTKYAEKAAGV